MCSALGLMFGTVFNPRTIPMLFGVVVLPITFLGCIYYPWAALAPIKWLQIAVLTNPLVYVSEGFRAALTNASTMSLWAIYPVLVGLTALFTAIGIRNFRKRVIA
jgi:ABC-2 type transport system permease protein